MTMKPLFGKLLGEAQRLTRGGKLLDATAAIQRALGGAAEVPRARSAASGGVVLEGLVRERDERAPTARPRFDAGLSKPRAASPAGSRPAGRFEESVFTGTSGSRTYKLYVPTAASPRAPGLVVMLHGCTQSPDDFAAGTRMNALAEEHGFVVLYPEQAPRSNSSKCWNWFVPGDQRRGGGEPELLAAMTRHIVATEGIDGARVYAAGLSAGGAMAAILGREYPDLYAAVGVHSGLPQGAAHDVASAFSAMQGGAVPAGLGGLPSAGLFGVAQAAPAAARAPGAGAPVIVFHGDRDSTVHPGNGQQVVAAALDTASAAGGIVTDRETTTAGGRTVSRTVHRSARSAGAGPALAEHWVVHGAGHAWSGGSTAGSYTDVQGPDASREMVRFFETHPLASR